MAASAPSMRELRGSCHCGRNKYVIEIPPDGSVPTVREIITVVWDRSPLEPPTVRIPLHWYHSTTYALFPDETHSTIRRIYNASISSSRLAAFFPPIAAPTSYDFASQRHFCGYCGIKISEWLDGEVLKDWIFIYLDSFDGESLVRLEGHGVGGPGEGAENEKKETEQGARDAPTDAETGSNDEEMGWFEQVVTSSGGGRVRVTKESSSYGVGSVEWELREWTEGDETEGGQEATPGKRKLEDLEGMEE